MDNMKNLKPMNQEQEPLENNQSQKNSQENQNHSQKNSWAENGEHLENLKLENLLSIEHADSNDDPNAENIGGEDFKETNEPAGLLSREQFYQSLRAVMNLTGSITPYSGLAIKEDQEAAAKEASNDIYDTALDLGWYWLLSPGGKWFKRLTTISFFIGMKASDVSKDLKPNEEEEEEKSEDVSQRQSKEKPKNDDLPAGMEWMKTAKVA